MPTDEQLIEQVRAALSADQRDPPRDLLERIHRELAVDADATGSRRREWRARISPADGDLHLEFTGRRDGRRVTLGAVVSAVAVLVAVAVAIAAVVLLGGDHRQRSAVGSRPHAIPGEVTTTERCRARSDRLLMTANGAPPASAVSTVSVATGSIDGYRWDLRADTRENGFDAIEDGRLVLDGRTYGMCGGWGNPAEFALIDKPKHGILYGYIANPGTPQISFAARTGIFQVQDTRHVLGGTFFIDPLPQPACSYKSLTLRAVAKSLQPFGNDVHHFSFGACEPDQTVAIKGGDGGWSRPRVNPPAVPRTVARIALRPATLNTRASGTVQELDRQGRYAITITASGMTPNTKHNAYAVWLYKPPAMSKLLGFVSPGVRANGRLSTAGALPKDAARYNEILITLETNPSPPAPGKPVLIGHGSFR